MTGRERRGSEHEADPTRPPRPPRPAENRSREPDLLGYLQATAGNRAVHELLHPASGDSGAPRRDSHSSDGASTGPSAVQRQGPDYRGSWPAPPAAGAAFEANVVSKIDASIAALSAPQPNFRQAYDTLHEGHAAAQAVKASYEHSDPALATKVAVFTNGMNAVIRSIEPHVFKPREAENLASDARAIAAGARGLAAELH